MECEGRVERLAGEGSLHAHGYAAAVDAVELAFEAGLPDVDHPEGVATSWL